MGTNFYMLTTNKEMKNKYAPYSYELTDDPYFAYEIHVAKTSMGWLPLFQAHADGIKSVKEYKEAYDTGTFEIYDEYGNKYTWEEFDKRVLKFNGGKLGGIEPEKINNENIPIGYRDTCVPEYRPISHISGNKQSYKYKFKDDNKTIFVDAEGYEFEEMDFS